MFKPTFAALAVLVSSAQATVIWNGFFNSSSVVGNFDKWSFSNEIAPWQWYIHGPAATSEYLGLSSSFKNPADTTDAQGVRTTIDGTSFWNGQTMERTEILPQTNAPINAGHVYYHFSMSTSATNAPNPKFEHQIAFFESHFTELKYGLLSGASGTSDNTLRWMVNQVTQWSTPLVAGTWYNFAYDIDFSAGKVGLWASQGSAPLTQVVAPVSASASSNGADWHVGVLRLPNGGTNAAAEDFFWSGLFIENGSITTSIAGPQPGTGGSAPSSSSTSTVTTTSKSTSTSTPTSTITSSSSVPSSSPTGCTAAHYAQCGGQGFSGCTVCAAGTTCKFSNQYFSQCL